MTGKPPPDALHLVSGPDWLDEVEEVGTAADRGPAAVADGNPHLAAAVKYLGAVEHSERPGFVAGECGHAVAASEWVAGWRVCERCPQDGLEL